MKIVGLVCFRNERSFLAAHISSVMPWVDEIIGLDHSSTDGSAAIFEEVSGTRALAAPAEVRPWARGGEADVRNYLLEEGRRRGGTHFLMLDADECLSPTAGSSLRTELIELAPGEALCLPWIICWRSTTRYRVGRSIWNGIYKDFAFCDDGKTSYESANLIHLPRTPFEHSRYPSGTLQDLGGVIHYQFAFWESTQIKQAWYQCIEWLSGDKTAEQINRMYRPAKRDRRARTAQIPFQWMPPRLPTEPSSDWRLQEILEWLEIYGVEHFEQLDIWDLPELRRAFVNVTGRDPRPQTRLLLLHRTSRIAKRKLAELGLIREKRPRYLDGSP